MGHGCGSSEGASCRLGDDVAGVTGFVDAVLFLGEVVAPVFVEVAVGGDGAEFEDGFGAVQAPAGAGDVHAVFDEVAAGALDDAGGDGPAAAERGGVVEVGVFAGQVGGAGVGGGAAGAAEAGGGGLAADGGGYVGGVAGQDGQRVAADPGFGGGVAAVMEGPGRAPQVFDHVHEVDDDGDRDVADGGFAVDLVELVRVAVDQRDPGAGAGGVAPLGVVEDSADDGCGVGGDAGGQPFAAGGRTGPGVAALVAGGGQDVGRAAGGGDGVVDGADFGHPFAGADLAARQPGRQLGGRPGGFGGCPPAQRPGPHHHALAVARQHQQVTGISQRRDPPGVEGAKVGRSRGGEAFHLPFADPLAGRAFDGRCRAAEGAARALDRGQPPQPDRKSTRLNSSHPSISYAVFCLK